jgi:SagB-type dehydrogenase family enzyme
METPTQRLHRVNSYHRESGWEAPFEDPEAVRGVESMDPARFPWFYKRYPEDLPRVDLPRDLPATSAPSVAVLAGTAEVPPAPLDVPALSRLLHLSAGVVRTREWRLGTHLFRAAGSAGGRFPLEVYVALPEPFGDVPAGVHWYEPRQHALVQVGPAPQGGVATLVVTGVPWRTGWKYLERGYRHVFWDAGTMLSQTMAAARSGGLPARLYPRFPDAAVAELVGADRVHEWPVAVVALAEGPPVVAARGPAAAGAVDADPVEFPLETAAQRAAERAELGSPWDDGPAVAVTPPSSEPVESLVLRRGSHRRLDPGGVLAADMVRTCLAVAMRGVTVQHWVVVHAVDGTGPGVYRWPDMTAPVRGGQLRNELFTVCMEQSLGSDASFVVLSTVDGAAVDDREYREAQLAAGVVEGRLHLLAYAFGAAASGMTFFDSEIATLVRKPADGLLITCVGAPEYRSATGGAPGSPTSIRHVPERFDPPAR